MNFYNQLSIPTERDRELSIEIITLITLIPN